MQCCLMHKKSLSGKNNRIYSCAWPGRCVCENSQMFLKNTWERATPKHRWKKTTHRHPLLLYKLSILVLCPLLLYKLSSSVHAGFRKRSAHRLEKSTNISWKGTWSNTSQSITGSFLALKKVFWPSWGGGKGVNLQTNTSFLCTCWARETS